MLWVVFEKDYLIRKIKNIDFKRERKIMKNQSTEFEILILIHSNKLLMNKNEIELSLTKNSALTKDLNLNQFQSYQIFVGVIMIQYSIYNNFPVFCKIFNLESKNIFPSLWHLIRLRKDVGNIQLIYLGVDRN